MAKLDANYRMSHSVKNLLGSIHDKETRRVWKQALAEADQTFNTTDWVVMAHEISVNGTRPGKRGAK